MYRNAQLDVLSPTMYHLAGSATTSGQVCYQNVQLEELNPIMYNTWGWRVWNPLRPINPDSSILLLDLELLHFEYWNF